MASNVTTDPGAGGAVFVTRQISHDGDTAQLSGSFIMGIAGSEDAYTATAIGGDATNGLDVDVTRVIPGVSATHLGKAEDAAHSSGDTGVMMLGVRNDVLASLVDTDGDYVAQQFTDIGALWTELSPNLVDSGNSSTATLGIDAVFTGTGIDVLRYSSITVHIEASHNSAVDGMTFQFSSDNSNWDDINTFTYSATNGARKFTFGCNAQFFRVVYTNGGTGQTHFRLQTILHRTQPVRSIHRLKDDVDPDRSSTLSKSIILAQSAGTGDFMPVQATATGNFKISVQEVSDGLDVGAGNAGTETQRISISTDDVNLASINTNMGTVAGAVAAGQMQVDLVLANVTNVGTFAVQVDGDALTALQLIDDPVFADDAAFTLTSSKVMMAGGIRDDTLAALAAAEGDAIPLRFNSTGQLHVTGGTQFAEDVAHSSGDLGTQMLGVRNDDLAALAGTDGDYTPPQFTENGALYACLALNDDYKYAVIDDAASGDNTLVAAVASRKIRVLAAFMVAAGTVNARFESGAAGTALTGQMNLVVNSGFTLNYNPAGWFETAVNTLLNLELSAAVSVDGALVYIEVP